MSNELTKQLSLDGWVRSDKKSNPHETWYFLSPLRKKIDGTPKEAEDSDVIGWLMIPKE